MAGTSSTSLIDVVDPETGEPVGTAERAAALDAGLPVRTVHVFLFDESGRLLIQELGRARDRHPLLWGSSVAAFPRPGESALVAARRRTVEELGVSGSLHQVGTVRTVDGRSPKFVTVFEGRADAPRILEPGHVESLRFVTPSELDAALAADPSAFTDTFRQVYDWWRRERPQPGAA